MMESTLHPTPRPRDVLRQQVRATGFALGLHRYGPFALMALVMIVVAIRFDVPRSPVNFHPESQMVPAVLGFLLPFAVWKGERRFGPGFLWTLPVDRRRHALTKVFSGWVWLMTVVAVFVLWLLGLTLVTGGKLLPVETIRVLPSSAVPDMSALTPAALHTGRWAPSPVFWLVPFTAATGTYLFASALLLGLRHPLWWIAGAGMVLVVLDGVGAVTHVRLLREIPERVLEPLFAGPYGFDALLTARTESLHTLGLFSSGPPMEFWRGLPDPSQWAAATLLWTAAGLAALWAAASRHGELRRP